MPDRRGPKKPNAVESSPDAPYGVDKAETAREITVSEAIHIDTIAAQRDLTTSRNPGIVAVPSSPQSIASTESKTARSAGNEPVDDLLSIEANLDAVQQPICDQLQTLLNSMAGKSFGSKEANATVANAVHSLITRLRKRILSPKGNPSFLRRKEAGGAKHGVFELRANVDGKTQTDFAAVRLPAQLRLVDPRPDKRRRD